MLGLALLALPLQAFAVDLLVSNLVDTPDPALRGGTIVYSASVTNNTSDVAHGVAVTFTLDAATTFVAVSDAACTYAVGPHTVTCAYATLSGDVNGPGSAQVKNIDVTVRSLAGAGNTVAFSATVATTDLDSNLGNDTLNQITTIDDGADLSLVLSGSPSSVVAGASMVYTAAVANGGPNAAGATAASITLSPNVTYVSSSGSGWACGNAGQVVSCTRSSAALGALPAVTINTKVTGAFIGTITSTGVVSISGSASDFNNTNDSSTANNTVTNGTDLAITKTASSTILASNQPMSFVLAPRNLGPLTANNLTVSDSLPAGFTSITAGGSGWTCAVNGQDVSCTRAAYAVGAASNITIGATAPTVVAQSALVNSTTISATTPDGVSANNTGTVNFSVVPDGVDLSISKSKTPNPVAQGNNLTSTMRVSNHGPRAAASGEASVVDTLPAGESFVALASGLNWTCGAQVGQTVTCTYNAALAVGASSSDLMLTTSADGVGQLTNNACATYLDSGALLSDPISSNDCAGASSQSTSSPSSVDLRLTKSAAVATLAWNAPTITYTLTVTNGGPGSATGVVLADPIPGYVPGNTVVSASLTGGTSTALFNCTTGATVTCTQASGTMGNGTTAEFTVTVTRPLLDSSAQVGNVWTNTATVHSNNQGDTDPSNNTASASVQVDPVADVTVLNSVTPTSTPAGTKATYVVTVNNNGPSTAAGVTLSDVFTFASGSMTFVSATPSVGSCAAFNAGTSTLDCSLGAMTSGATATVTVVMRPDYMIAPPAPRTITNTATVASTTQESNAGNNSAASVLTVTQATLDLLVNNTDNVDPLGFVPAAASPVFPDNVVTYRNVILNRGPSVASGLVLTYTMRPPTGKSITFVGDKLAATGQVYSNNCDNLGVQVTGPAIQTITCQVLPGAILAAGNATTELFLDFHVDTQPNTGGDAYNSTVSIAANEPEPVTGNNAVNQSTTIKMRADLQLAKAARAFIGGVDSPAATINFRQPFYWVVTLTNAGPGDSNATTFTDSLPAGVVPYAGGTSAPYNAAPYNTGVLWSTNNGAPTNGSCTGTSTITCAIGLLESGKAAVIRIPVVAASSYSASVTNCASATTSDVDPNAANNTNVCAAVAQQRSSIAGFVYADRNNDAAKAGGEAGIASVGLRLDGTDIYGNTVTNLAVTTDGSGAFSFTNRTPGTYTITETQPGTHLDGSETAGTSGGTATAAAGDTISAISLPANTAATGYLFGELLPAAVSGHVFMDLDTDAVRDLTGVPATDESAGVTGVSIALTGTDDLGAVSTSLNTAANGAYSFTRLRPGTYQVVEATLGGVTHTGMTIGSKGGNDGAAAHTAGQAVLGVAKRTISAIPVAAGDAAANYNFGESGQGLGGLVYADLNNNGSKDAGEPGIAGVVVALSGLTSGGLDVCVVISPNPCATATDSSGAYGFIGLPASDASGYTLTEQSQASAPLSNYADGIDTLGTVNGAASGAKTDDKFTGIIIATGQVGSNYNFGEIAASLAGNVYLDVDRNNTFGAGDTALAGVTVTLSGLTASGANVCTVVASCAASTDASGDFSFTALPASNGAGYTLTQTQPVDYVDATNTVGTGATTPGGASVVGGKSVFSGIVLGAGQGGVNYRFGEQTGSLTGFVYIDQNNNGVKDAGETGITGVTLAMTGSAAGGGTPCGTPSCVTTSAAGGAYTFGTLRNAGGAGYTVTESQPAAYLDGKVRKGTVGGVSCVACVDTAANIISAIAFNAGSGHADFNFGELQAASIAGNVYVDGDLDASFGAGEALAGVTVGLTGTDDLGNAVNTTTVTAADGSYSFGGLRPSNPTGYTLTETHPTGYSDFGGNAGTQPGAINGTPAGTATLNMISDLVLASGGMATAHNFREQGASIAGVVYLDANSNRVRDGAEGGMPSITVTLNGPVARSMQTSSTGLFAFTGLIAGTYSLVETQPGGFADGVDLPGTAGGIVNTPKNSITNIVLATAVDATAYLFGEQPEPGQNGSLAGTVYLDANKDGARDSADALLPGVTLTLAGTDFDGAKVALSAQTDAAGHYVFPVVRPGMYTLTESQPAGFMDFDGASGTAVGTIAGGTAGLNTVTGIVMPMTGGTALAYDFREQLVAGTAKLGGSVYADANANGKLDPGEALAGVTVTLSGVDANGATLGVRNAQTGADGAYLFEALAAGTYSVVETQPDGYGEFPGNTGSAAGSAGGTLDAGPNKVAGVPVAAASTATAYDFREIGASLAGLVYRDDNHDGVKDGGEPGIAGVVVSAVGTSGAARSATSGADGRFTVVGLAAGSYSLVQTPPQGYVDGKESVGTIAGVGAADLGKADNSGFDDSAAHNTISGIKLGAGQRGENYLFGERRGRLQGYVYMDDNNNGARDAGEAPLPGVHVTLSGRLADGSDACAGIACVAITDSTGAYAFDGVGVGRYSLVETQTDLDTARIVDGKETAGKAGGKTDNGGFGTAASQNTIGQVEISAPVFAANNGRFDGYLFGERLRGGPTLKPPIVSGYVWFDRRRTRVRPTDETHEGAKDWTVTLSQDGTLVCTAKSEANGFYQFDNLHCPGYQESGLPIGSGFVIRFSKDGNNMPNVASSGGGAGEANGSSIRNITLKQGDDVSEQNLPLDPSGVVYDSATRQPIAGAVVSFSGPVGFDPARHLLGGIPALTQTTGSDGLYQFFLQNDFPAGAYRLVVASYPAGYLPAESLKIPACAGTPNVGPIPDPALVQKTDTAPGLSVPPHNPAACVGMVAGGAASTQYYFSFNIHHASAPILNNHIPLDPADAAGLALSKTGDKQQIEFGETLGYTITVKQTAGTAVAQLSVRDSLPAGFSLVHGTVKVNGKPVADPPPGAGAVLVFNLGPLASKQQAVLTYRLRAGVGSLQGDGINRATAYACNTASGCVAPATGQALPNAYPSNTGVYKVRLTAGVFTEQACVAGKVFVDCNGNHVQDSEELGVPGVRLYLEDGTSFTTDVEGKYSYCGLSPKSHVIKADRLTLPRGSRLTTTSSRNLGDANSLWLDAKNGELLRADFAEGSCSAPVIEQVKARRSQTGVRSVETEATRLPGVRFESKQPAAPRQATDSANHELLKPGQGNLPARAGESRAQ